MEKIWKNKHVSRLTKTRTIKTMVFPEVLYGCETWTKTRAMEKKTDACEIWIWRKILRVAWTERRTNKSILQEIGEMGGCDEGGRSGEGDDVGVWRGEKEEGTAEERWMEKIMARTAMSLEELREVVRNRSAWRMLTMMVARIQRINGTR